MQGLEEVKLNNNLIKKGVKLKFSLIFVANFHFFKILNYL